MNIKNKNTGLEKGDEYLRTRDTRFASALLSLGFGLWEKTPFHLYEDAKSGKQQILWQFNPTSDCKKFSAYKMLKAYKDPNLLSKEDNHSKALAICVATLKNRELLIDICNNAEPVLKSWEDDGNLWYVPANTELGQDIINRRS